MMQDYLIIRLLLLTLILISTTKGLPSSETAQVYSRSVQQDAITSQTTTDNTVRSTTATSYNSEGHDQATVLSTVATGSKNAGGSSDNTRELSGPTSSSAFISETTNTDSSPGTSIQGISSEVTSKQSIKSSEITSFPVSQITSSSSPTTAVSFFSLTSSLQSSPVTSSSETKQSSSLLSGAVSISTPSSSILLTSPSGSASESTVGGPTQSSAGFSTESSIFSSYATEVSSLSTQTSAATYSDPNSIPSSISSTTEVEVRLKSDTSGQLTDYFYTTIAVTGPISYEPSSSGDFDFVALNDGMTTSDTEISASTSTDNSATSTSSYDTLTSISVGSTSVSASAPTSEPSSTERPSGLTSSEAPSSLRFETSSDASSGSLGLDSTSSAKSSSSNTDKTSPTSTETPSYANTNPTSSPDPTHPESVSPSSTDTASSSSNETTGSTSPEKTGSSTATDSSSFLSNEIPSSQSSEAESRHLTSTSEVDQIVISESTQLNSDGNGISTSTVPASDETPSPTITTESGITSATSDSTQSSSDSDGMLTFTVSVSGETSSPGSNFDGKSSTSASPTSVKQSSSTSTGGAFTGIVLPSAVTSVTSETEELMTSDSTQSSVDGGGVFTSTVPASDETRSLSSSSDYASSSFFTVFPSTDFSPAESTIDITTDIPTDQSKESSLFSTTTDGFTVTSNDFTAAISSAFSQLSSAAAATDTSTPVTTTTANQFSDATTRSPTSIQTITKQSSELTSETTYFFSSPFESSVNADLTTSFEPQPQSTFTQSSSSSGMAKSSYYTDISIATSDVERSTPTFKSTDGQDSTYSIATGQKESSSASEDASRLTATSTFTNQPTNQRSDTNSADTSAQSVSRADYIMSSKTSGSSDTQTTNVISSSVIPSANPENVSSRASSFGSQSASTPETDSLINSFIASREYESSSKIPTANSMNELTSSRFTGSPWPTTFTGASSEADTQAVSSSPTATSTPNIPAQTSSHGGDKISTSSGAETEISIPTVSASSPTKSIQNSGGTASFKQSTTTTNPRAGGTSYASSEELSTVTAGSPLSSSTSTWWLPNSIQVQSQFSESSSFNPSVTATLPHVIAPQTSVAQPPDTSEITIGFDKSLNYEFLVTHPQSPAQIFAFLPPVLKYPFEAARFETFAGKLMKSQNNSVSNYEQHGTTTLAPAPNPDTIEKFRAFNGSQVRVIQIMPMVLEDRDYLLSVAVLYFPKEFIQALNTFITDENSMLYQNPNPTFHALAQLIDPSIPITGLIVGSDNPSPATASAKPVPSNSQSESLGSTTGDEKSGSLESTVNSPITFAIKRRLAIYLTCFVFGVVLWIAASLSLLKHLRDAGHKDARITVPSKDYEKGAYLSADVVSIRSTASSTPGSLRLQQSVNTEDASNEALPEDLIVVNENTVYSLSHGLEYYVAEDGSFYYAGALDSTTDGNESTKQASADLEDIEEFLYSADQDESSVAVDGTYFDLGSLEIDEDGNFVVSDASLEADPMAVGTGNSETVESYNNKNLYKMMQVASSSRDPDQIFSEGTQPTNTWGVSDSSRHAEASDNSPVGKSAYGFYSSDSSHNFDQSILGGESIDEFLYNGPIGSDWADELQIDEIDDDVVDIHVNDLDELDEEMYRRLSKMMNQQSNESGMLHISNVIAAKAQNKDTRTTSSETWSSENQL